MKKITLILVAFICSQAFAQEIEGKNVPSKITKVTVFVSGAQITREAEVSIEKGITNLVFEGVSPYINEQSIQLGGTSGISLLSVVHRVNYMDEAELSPKIKKYQDSIDDIQFLIDQLHNSKFVTEQEIELILANKSMRGEKGMDMASFEEMQEVFRKRLPTLKDELLKLKIEEKRLTDKQKRMKNQLKELTSSVNKGIHEIVASIKSENAMKLKLDLNYFTSAASWYPAYDIRCKSIGSPLQLIYKANIQQTTGEDWNKVMLKISLGNPNLSGTKPELQANQLRWFEFKSYDGYRNAAGNQKAKMQSNSISTMESKSEERYKDNNATMKQTALNVEFSIAIPYTIPSNGKYMLIDAQTFEMPAEYNLSAVPKLDKSAFLMAGISAKDEINQLTGMASVYFEGMYTGQSAVIANENDSMSISLGRDKSIIIDRKRLKEKTSKSFLGSKKTEESGYEIAVRNTKSTPITITIEDQIPITTDKDIEVEVEDLGGGILDEATGKITWKITIGAGETKKLTFSFNVKYPKNKKVSAY